MTTKKSLSLAFIVTLALSVTMLLKVSPVFAEEPFIGVHPSHTITWWPNTFTVKINVSSTVPFIGYQFYLYWNRTYINATSLAEAPPAAWNPMYAGAGLQWNYNATHGRIQRGVIDGHHPFVNVTGTFTVATITFKVIKNSSSTIVVHLDLDYDKTFLSDATANKIVPYYVYDGDVTLGTDVTINAHCNMEGMDRSVSITIDGSSTGFNTPHTFIGHTGTHTFTVPDEDASGHAFREWNTGQKNTTITVASGGIYTAYYGIEYILTITTTVGGTTDPMPGTHNHWSGTVVGVTAIPSIGYFLDHWELDEIDAGSTNPIDVTMDTNHTLHAVFKIHDVSVIDITCTKTVLGQGYSTNMTTTVANQGNYTETFDIILYANATSIASQTITLTSGNSTTITFVWNTTGFAKGNYTISVNATIILNETDTSDNRYVDGVIKVGVPGDLNGDNLCDLLDLVKVAGRFGKLRGDPEYDPNYDINDDNLIDLPDLVKVAIHFGTTDP